MNEHSLRLPKLYNIEFGKSRTQDPMIDLTAL